MSECQELSVPQLFVSSHFLVIIFFHFLSYPAALRGNAEATTSTARLCVSRQHGTPLGAVCALSPEK